MFDKKAIEKYQDYMFVLYDDGVKQHEYNFGIDAGTRHKYTTDFNDKKWIWYIAPNASLHKLVIEC